MSFVYYIFLCIIRFSTVFKCLEKATRDFYLYSNSWRFSRKITVNNVNQIPIFVQVTALHGVVKYCE